MKCDIIMPVWDQLELTRECIESISKHTNCPFRFIIVDNGSRGQARSFLESLSGQTNPEVRLIKNEANLGFVKAVNQGLRESTAPYICIMNNDTLATEGWLTEMVEIAEKNPNIGLVNPSSNSVGQKCASGDVDRYAQSLKSLKGEFIEMGAALGFCMLFKRKIFEKLGFFDEIYGIGNFEDTEYSRKVESLGMVCARAKASYVYHRTSRSFLKKRDFEEIFRKNQRIFYKRWGRPKRLLYIIARDHKKLYEWMKAESLERARFGDWVWVFHKEEIPFAMREHSNIRIFMLPSMLFKANTIFRVLVRKKKFDSIYVDEDELLEKLNRFKPFHNADVMLMGG